MILAFALPSIAFHDDLVETRRIFPDAFKIRIGMPKASFASRRFKENALVGTLLEERIGSVDGVQFLLIHIL